MTILKSIRCLGGGMIGLDGLAYPEDSKNIARISGDYLGILILSTPSAVSYIYAKSI